MEVNTLWVTPAIASSFKDAQVISAQDMQSISALKTAPGVLAICKQPEETVFQDDGFTLVLDAVRDPGNLGTIIRLCDWFNIKQILCSEDTVDCFNAKVVQATMGSLARVKVFYRDLGPLLQNTSHPVYASSLEGNSLYDIGLPETGYLVMGSESHGVSQSLMALATTKVSIPRNVSTTNGPESLNVAVATSIFLSERFRLIGK